MDIICLLYLYPYIYALPKNTEGKSQGKPPTAKKPAVAGGLLFVSEAVMSAPDEALQVERVDEASTINADVRAVCRNQVLFRTAACV